MLAIHLLWPTYHLSGSCVVRSIQVPSSVGCLTEECKDAHCQGNRLVLLPGGKLGMSLCHYKVHKK